MRGLTVPLFALVLLVAFGCSKDDSTSPTPGDQLGSLSGVVEDVWGSGLSGVTVRVGALTVQTNEQGWFHVSNVPVGSVNVAVQRTGYLPTYRSTIIRKDQTTHLGTLVLVRTQTISVQSEGGGTVETGDGTGTATFPPGAFVRGGQPYVGEVLVEIAAMKPGDQGFYGAFPGSFEGIRTNGTTVPFQSYGFMGVSLFTPDQSPLALAQGRPADLTMLIPPELLASAPESMPMWYFDEATGRWREEGIAVREGNRYRASVAHLTIWNWDVPLDDICSVAGTVVNQQGAPVAGALVQSQGISVTHADEAFTNDTGRFLVRALKNSTVLVVARKGTYASSPVTVNAGVICPVELGEPLVLREPTFSIVLRWGENPSDLDSHLFIPMTWDANWDLYHIAYYNMGSLTGDPYTALDTDDVSSFGPEIISGFELYQGTYSYFVHHFSGSGTIAQSPAVVELEIGGSRRTYEASRASGTVGDYWHVFDFVVDANRRVSVRDVNRFEGWDFGNLRIYPHGASGSNRTDLPQK